jgi:hypothetical protein
MVLSCIESIFFPVHCPDLLLLCVALKGQYFENIFSELTSLREECSSMVRGVGFEPTSITRVFKNLTLHYVVATNLLTK